MKAMLIDITKCIGCTECVSACKMMNNLPQDKPRSWQKNDGLSAVNWISIMSKDDDYVRKQCRHCEDPACASVCPVGALHQTDMGAVVYDSDKCLGCRYCMMACPYGIPRYDWDSPVPYVKKCIMCYDNIKSGKINEPACVSACPEKVAIFGEREELLKIARQRITSYPEKYMAHIYGENEVGGTNVIYLTRKDLPLDFLHYYNHRADKNLKLLGQPDINEPIPDTTKTAMGSVPYAFLGMGGVMTGLYWIINRRNKVAQDDKEDNHEKN